MTTFIYLPTVFRNLSVDWQIRIS